MPSTVTIGVMRYDIIAATAEFEKDLLATKKEINAAARVARDTAPAYEKIGDEIERLNNLRKKGLLTQKEYARAIDQVKRKHEEAMRAELRRQKVAADKRHAERVERLRKSLDDVVPAQERHGRAIDRNNRRRKQAADSTWAWAKRLGALAVAYRAFDFARRQVGESFNLALQLQRTEANFSTLLGNLNDARVIMQELRQFAGATPFRFSGLQEATTQLLSYGFAANEIMPTLQMLGDVSKGQQDQFNALARAYGQVRAAGRLMGQELLQFINAGFNPLMELAEGNQEEYQRLRKEMERGNITLEQVTEAFQKATAEGGRFAGALDNIMDTDFGAIETLSGSIERLKTDMGTNLTGPAGDAASALNDLMKSARELATQTNELAEDNWMVDWANRLSAIALPAQTVLRLMRETNETTMALSDSTAELAQQQADAAASEAAGKTFAAVEKRLEQYKLATHLIGLEADEAERLKFANEGATEEQMKQFDELQKRRNMLQEIVDKEKEAQEAAEEARKARVQAEIEAAEAVLKGMQEARKEWEKNLQKSFDMPDISTLQRGSVEEYQFFRQQQQQEEENRLRREAERKAEQQRQQMLQAEQDQVTAINGLKEKLEPVAGI